MGMEKQLGSLVATVGHNGGYVLTGIQGRAGGGRGHFPCIKEQRKGRLTRDKDRSSASERRDASLVSLVACKSVGPNSWAD